MYAITAPRYIINYESQGLVQNFSLIGEDFKKLLSGIYLHSGRTDSSGGHKDKKNKSGLGSYHYHHGVSAHLHPNGVCPYGSKQTFIINPYTGNKISLGQPYFIPYYDENAPNIEYYSLNLVSKALTAQDKFGASLGLGTGINPSFPGGSFYACPAGNSSIDGELGENLSFVYPKNILGFVQDNTFFKTDCGELQLLCHNKQAEADDAICYAYVSLEAIREYMMKDGYFTDFSDNGSGVWNFTVRKPMIKNVKVTSLNNNAPPFNIGDILTVEADIDNVANAKLTVGTHTEDKDMLLNQNSVKFNSYVVTNEDAGILIVNVEVNTGGTAIDAETVTSTVQIQIDGLGSAPLNDYKTIANPNLIGMGASKNYITLSQLKGFNFEYDRQTYINKLISYTANDFQCVVTNITMYLNVIQDQLDYLKNEFTNISDQDIVSNFNYHIEKYGIGISAESVLMFMAITAQESMYGKRMAELWSPTLGYNYNQRGGGYSQLTGITNSNPTGNQIPFMTSIGYSNNDISNIVDLPFHIATYLPMSSACYAWTKGNAINCDITTDVIEYGIKQGAEMKLIYLAVSYAINGGYTKSGLQNLLNGKIFSEPSTPPIGWADRKASFNNALSIFPNGTSVFTPF